MAVELYYKSGEGSMHGSAKQRGNKCTSNVHTLGKTNRKRRAMYIPSWLDKVEKVQKNMAALSTGNEMAAKLTGADLQHDMDAVMKQKNQTALTKLNGADLSYLLSVGVHPHELLEKQYQFLHENFVVPTRPKQNNLYAQRGLRNRQNRNVNFHGKGPEPTSGSNIHAHYSNSEDSVHVKELLQSDPLGSDHFYKHLQCVKELAKRYRKSTKRRHITSILEIDE